MFVLNIVVSLLTLVANAASIQYRQTRGSLQQVTNFGPNPTNVGFHIYVPKNLAAKPAVIVAVHYCTGTGPAYYAGTSYASLAETHGFIVIYPTSPWEGRCWDVSSKASLTHNGGGDSNAIVNMVSWTLNQFSGDASRVYVTGTSSGAMMTNVLSAAYPDVFKAASVYAGVPAGCFVSAAGLQAAWNNTCAQGQTINTPETWANVVKTMYPGYTGSYPPIQLYHGGRDEALLSQNFQEEVKQWTGVWGYNYQAPVRATPNDPASGWTRTVYGPGVQGIFNPSVTHNLPTFANEDMKWFGFTGTAPVQPPTSSIPAPSPVASAVARYGQCGGMGYSGSTTCVSGTKCVVVNNYYSQCQ